MYLRLSSADEETGFTKIESDSISNQRMCINNFLNNDKQLSAHTRFEFVDDGFTATNSDRPQFLKMLDMAQNGDLNIIVVRDFSRFFRDYVEAGNYLECVFPFLDIRFISINDRYDSDDYKGTTGGLEMAMRNIIYSSYSRDISIKVKTALRHMKKQGKYVASFPPFGYLWHNTEPNKLELDTETAPLIKHIFSQAKKGKTTGEIAAELNANNIPTPAKRFSEKYPNSRKFKTCMNATEWNYGTVYRILQNLVYTGAIVSRKNTRARFISSEEQAITIYDGTHEAIISKQDFQLVQQLIKNKKSSLTKKTCDYPLRSLVKCGNCKRNMARAKRVNVSNIFTCIYHNANDINSCHKFSIKEKELEKTVYKAIVDYISFLENKVSLIKETEKHKPKVQDIASLEVEIERLENYKLRLYENYIERKLTQEMYLKQKAKTDENLKDLKLKIEETRLSDKENVDENMKKTKGLISFFSKDNTFNNEMARTFINAIYVYDENTIKIEWKFKDVF